MGRTKVILLYVSVMNLTDIYLSNVLVLVYILSILMSY